LADPVGVAVAAGGPGWKINEFVALSGAVHLRIIPH
jgi:hypothetical protein